MSEWPVPVGINLIRRLDIKLAKLRLFSVLIRSLVAVQIASDLFEYKEKARSIQVYMSTFDAGIGQIRAELNRYDYSSMIFSRE